MSFVTSLAFAYVLGTTRNKHSISENIQYEMSYAD